MSTPKGHGGKPAGSRSPSAEAASAARSEELVQQILAEFERTFTTAERGAALQSISDGLRRLDEDALRSMLYGMGIRAGDELEPGPEEQGPGRPRG